MAVAVPLRSDFDAAQLRALAKRARDPDQTRRLLALAAIYDGASRTEAAQIGCVTLQIVRDWPGGSPALRLRARPFLRDDPDDRFIHCLMEPNGLRPHSGSR